jgi:hypothetical protein
MLFHCISLHAQVIDLPRSYAYIVRYDKSHTLMRQGSDFNVVDLEMEWPVVIDSTQVSALQQQIASKVLMSDGVDYDISVHDFLAHYGTPVSGKLDSLPDDRHFCYVTASATIKSYSPGKYIVYQFDRKVTPQSLSSQQAADDHLICVYDLHTQKILRLEDLMKIYQLQSSADSQLITLLTSVLNDNEYNSLQSVEVLAVWPEDSLVGMRVRYGFDNGGYTSQLKMRYDCAKSVLTKHYRNLLKPAVAHQTVYASLPLNLMKDTLCYDPDQLPIEKDKDLAKRYMGAQTISSYQGTGTVLVSYVVDRDGRPTDLAVVNPVSPSADRWAVSVVRGMPPLQPAMKAGRPVPTRMIRGFRFQ